MIECAGLHYSYDGTHDALDGVSLTIADGEFVSVLGGNGSGKSTLARHLDALLVPGSGHVTVDGLDTTTRRNVYDIRSRVGLVFQNPDDQIVAGIVEDDVAFGPENLGVPTGELRARVTEALAAVGLSGFERRETASLSGGQKQRLALAGVLAMRPQTLVLDEASSMLDPRGRAALMHACHRLHSQGMSIVMITHFMEEAAEAERVVVLSHGRVALDGTPDEVFSQADVLASLGLDIPMPYRVGLELREKLPGLTPRVTVDAMIGELQAQAAQRGQAPLGTTTAQRAQASSGAEGAEGSCALGVEDVSFAYERGACPALRDISIEVREGEVLGLLGHTGSGKSTLVQLLAGLEKPIRGRVTCKSAGRVGVVFQYPERQLFARTVREDVAFGPRNLGITGAELATRVDKAIRGVGLDPEAVGDVSPFALSGGQQRRIAFAGVLAMEPKVLVFDEPVAGLDPRSRREFLRLLRKLHAQGRTIVMTSHNMDDAAELCDRVVVLDHGERLLEGTPAEVFSHADELRRAGLGLPGAQEMASRLIELGWPLRRDALYTPDALASDLATCLGAGAPAGTGTAQVSGGER